jgi:predicted RNA-binding Zn-ribbon protein involved in translation (DUF1610 family)
MQSDQNNQPAPIYYRCMRRASQLLAPEALPELDLTHTCPQCGEQLVLMPHTLRKAEQIAANTGRELRLICHDCAEPIVERETAGNGIVMVGGLDPQASARMREMRDRYRARQN